MVLGEPLILKDLSLPISQWDPTRNLFKLAKFRGFSQASDVSVFAVVRLEGLSKAAWRPFLRSRFWASPLFNTVDSGQRIGRESAEYGLRLFESLNLQLLMVTPLQKIHVIEPHISSVGFVHNEDGRISMLRNLTIEEYRAERAARIK